MYKYYKWERENCECITYMLGIYVNVNFLVIGLILHSYNIPLVNCVLERFRSEHGSFG